MRGEGSIRQPEQPGKCAHLMRTHEFCRFRDQVPAEKGRPLCRQRQCRLHPLEACSAFEFMRSTFHWSMMAWTRNWDMDRIAVSTLDNGARNRASI